MARKRKAKLGADSTAPDAARHLLRSRLRSVGRLIDGVSPKRVEKPEYVHQLRVSIRRADAAINAFEPCVGRPEATDTRKRLKALRKAAGATRDCDAHAAILPSLLSVETPDQKHLRKFLRARLD